MFYLENADLIKLLIIISLMKFEVSLTCLCFDEPRLGWISLKRIEKEMSPMFDGNIDLEELSSQVTELAQAQIFTSSYGLV